MRQKSHIKILLSAVILMAFAFAIYTIIVFCRSKTLDDTKAYFARQSVNDQLSFAQSDSLSYPRWGYTTWVPDSNADTPEMFLIHNQKYLLVTGFNRFVADAHFTDKKGQPVSLSKAVLKDNKGDEFGTYFVYSQNKLSICRIRCEFINSKTDSRQVTEKFPSAEMPFALFIPLDDIDASILSIVCYDANGNIVYEDGVFSS